MLLATPSDKKHIVNLLCESFELNKSVNYIVKQGKQRGKSIKYLMEFSFNVCLKYGEVYLTEDKNACALILFPEKERISFHSLFWNLKLILFGVGICRLKKIRTRSLSIKANYPDTPILYLWFLGVKKNVQQKGLGSTMISIIKERSKALKRPIYLETSMPENIAFYIKHEFEIYKELDFGHNLYLIRSKST